MKPMNAMNAIVIDVPPDSGAGRAWKASKREASWQSRRTSRSLLRMGVACTTVDEDRLASALMQATGPVWIVRAGALPVSAPRLPSPSATGRTLLAFGARDADERWASLLASSRGELSRVAWRLPSVESVFVSDPRAFAIELGTSAFDATCRRLASSEGIRAVYISSFDVIVREAPHVAFLVTTLHRGGGERVVLDLERRLRAMKWDTTLAVLDDASRTAFPAPPGAIFLAERARGRTDRVLELGETAIARGADLIHAHLVGAADLQILSHFDVPVVTTIHNSRPGWPARLETVFAAEVALAIACSRDVEAEWMASGAQAVVRTVWNGIEERAATTSRIIEKRTSRPSLRARASVEPAPALRLLTVANHRPQKRLERLPAIVAELRKRGHDARVVIAGEPVASDPAMTAIAGRIAAEATRLGIDDAVEMVGAHDDVDSLYEACDAVVSTSAYEGLSLVHLEALRAGVPLVTTAVSGTSELALKHTNMAVVPLEADASTFAGAILDASSRSSRDKPTSGFFSRASTSAPTLAPDFTSYKMTERHAELFERVLATSHRRARHRVSRSSLLGAGERGGITLVANNFSTGGAQSSARRLLLELASAGVPVRAIVIQEQAAYPTPGRAALTLAGIEVFAAPRAGDVDPVVTARAVARAIDEAEPDAVLFWNVIAQHKVLIADLVWDAPIWDVSPGEMYFTSFARYLEKPRTGLPYLSMRDYGRRLAGAVVKYASERTLAERALGVRVEVIPNGVAVPTQLESRPHPRASSARGETVVIGTLARLCVDKKLEQLIDAVARAAAPGRFEGCELRIAGAVSPGEDAYVASLRERARGLPIAWVGERESAAFLAELDLFATVSEPSGCPNASLEAMAAGLAVVATDVGGACEQIEDGVSGFVVPRGDSAALGDAIARLARDPEARARMGARAHARALARFDVKRMARDYARLCLGSVPSTLEEGRRSSHDHASPLVRA